MMMMVMIKKIANKKAKSGRDICWDHKTYNFLDCDRLKKKLLFSTNSLAKLLSEASISQSHSKL